MNVNTESPKVSVIIPVHNREKTIIRSIESVLNQNYSNLELIIIDDYSTDNTVKIIKRYIKDKPNIELIRNKKKLGVSKSRNKGILNSTGEYIAFLDSDDTWEKNHLSSSICCMKEENVEIAYSFWYRDVNGNVSSIKDNTSLMEKIITFSENGNNKNTKEYFYFDKNFSLFALKESVYCFHICTLVMHRNVIKDCGLFNKYLKCNEDIDFSYRILMTKDFVLLKEEGYTYSIVTGSDSLYSFIDRRHINFDILLENEIFLKKVYLNVKYKIRFYKILKKNIRKHYTEDNIEKSLLIIEDNISKRIRTLAILSLGCKKFIPYILFYVLIMKYRNDFLRLFSIEDLCIS